MSAVSYAPSVDSEDNDDYGGDGRSTPAAKARASRRASTQPRAADGRFLPSGSEDESDVSSGSSRSYGLRASRRSVSRRRNSRRSGGDGLRKDGQVDQRTTPEARTRSSRRAISQPRSADGRFLPSGSEDEYGQNQQQTTQRSARSSGRKVRYSQGGGRSTTAAKSRATRRISSQQQPSSDEYAELETSTSGRSSRGRGRSTGPRTRADGAVDGRSTPEARARSSKRARSQPRGPDGRFISTRASSRSGRAGSSGRSRRARSAYSGSGAGGQAGADATTRRRRRGYASRARRSYRSPSASTDESEGNLISQPSSSSRRRQTGRRVDANNNHRYSTPANKRRIAASYSGQGQGESSDYSDESSDYS